MNELKKLYVVLGTLVAVILLVVLSSFISSKKEKQLLDNFKDAFNGPEKTLVYIGRPTCGYCNLLTPSLEDMASRYNFDYLYVNIDDINTSVLEQILADLQITELGTPYLAVVSGGKVVDAQKSYVDYDKLFEFLQKNEIINKDAKLLLNYINLSDYKAKLNQDKLNVFVIGQSTCIWCVRTKVQLNEVVAKNNIEINYVNLSYFTSDELTELKNSLSYFTDTWDGGTPTTIITKNGALVKSFGGYTTADEFIKFFKENGVL